jgi:FkbM family methyltransferase
MNLAPSAAVSERPLPQHNFASTPVLGQFRHTVSVRRSVAERVRQRLGLWLFRKSLPLFVRGTDSISLEPLVNGQWDHVLQALFRHAAASGFNDFLIDIGANIGLTSCQCGTLFRQVVMYEPNPELFPVLRLNAGLMLRAGNWRAFNFGLGPVARQTTLNVPAENFGGAFVHDEHNAYSEDLFARKHAQTRFDLKRYRQIPIRIEATTEVLAPLFAELQGARAPCGVIKIDVEGYEKAIIEGIAACLPSGVRCLIVFENWDARLDVAALLGRFGRSASAFLITRSPAPLGALWKDLPGMLLRRGAHFELTPALEGSCEGEIVLSL